MHDQEEIKNDDRMRIKKNADDRLKAGTVHAVKLTMHLKWCHLKKFPACYLNAQNTFVCSPYHGFDNYSDFPF